MGVAAALHLTHTNPTKSTQNHQAVELDRRSPECWCAVGNCFSLQKEHEAALKVTNLNNMN
jgi:hypothetical protein